MITYSPVTIQSFIQDILRYGHEFFGKKRGIGEKVKVHIAFSILIFLLQ